MASASGDGQGRDACRFLFCHGRESVLKGGNRPCLLGVVPFGRCRNPLRTRVGFGNEIDDFRGFRQ